jgi:MSHA pilin protein MshC
MRKCRATNKGFTLIELISVIVITGVLSFVAVRHLNHTTFDTRGYADEVSSMLRFAQKEAIAKRRNVCVSVVPASVTLTFASAFGGACDTPLPSPSGDALFSRAAPSGVTLSGGGSFIFAAPAGGTFSFDSQGRPWSSAGALVADPSTITVTGDVVVVVTIEAETGYVH